MTGIEIMGQVVVMTLQGCAIIFMVAFTAGFMCFTYSAFKGI